jgi:predicted nucleic acid-binding protein
MILVDTSVWIDHLRKGDTKLKLLLEDTLVLCHPFIVGELACGNLSKRSEVLQLLDALPEAISATNEEVRAFVEPRSLMARGIGFIDAHLLTSAALTPPAKIWTRDRRLAAVAEELDLRHA